MNVQVHHVIVHTPEQAREIIAEAVTIADGAVRDGAEWKAVFEQACRLLGQRHSLVLTPQAVPMDLGALTPRNNRR